MLVVVGERYRTVEHGAIGEYKAVQGGVVPGMCGAGCDVGDRWPGVGDGRVLPREKHDMCLSSVCVRADMENIDALQ